MRISRLSLYSCSCLAFLLLLLALVLALIPAPASADLLSDLLSGGLGGGGGGSRGGSRNNHPVQQGHAHGGGGRGADTCDAYICPLPDHEPLSKPGWIPLSNGCGSYGFRIRSPWHEPCCDEHDKCYSTCGRRRERCDADFQACMKQSCARLLPSKPTQRDHKAHSECEGQANLFSIATTSMGCGAFQDSQREACHCTPLQKAKAAVKAGAQKAEGAVKDAAAAVKAGVQKITQRAQDEL